MLLSANEAAFLATIRHSEGTDRADDPYRVVFGFSLILANLSDHPAITGEWTGVQTKWGHTSAAGAYQFERLTWMECKAALGLMDFTAPSQDAAALFLIRQKGALDLVNMGDIEHAIWLCSSIWASLPGSTSKQPQRAVATLIDAFGKAGGTLAA